VSSITEDELITTRTNDTRILELEHKLQMKENEMRALINDYELKLQMKENELNSMKNELSLKLQMKDLEIASLRTQPQQQRAPPKVEEPNVKLVVAEVPKKPKRSTQEILQTDFKDAPTIESCYKKLLSPDYNDYLIPLKMVNGEDKIILSPERFKQSDFQSCPIKNATKGVQQFFEQFDKKELPFYCSDRSRNTLHIKTEKGWMQETSSNVDEFNKLVFILGKSFSNSIQYSVSNMQTEFKTRQSLFQKNYKMSYSDWTTENQHDKIIIRNVTIYDSDPEVESHNKAKLARKMIKLLCCISTGAKYKDDSPLEESEIEDNCDSTVTSY
jgi:hypothetical protein